MMMPLWRLFRGLDTLYHDAVMQRSESLHGFSPFGQSAQVTPTDQTPALMVINK
jgi:hypothetical protein